MKHQSHQRNTRTIQGGGIAGGPEMVLLGGHSRTSSAGRVLSANFDSSRVRPADLDAFLRGSFSVC